MDCGYACMLILSIGGVQMSKTGHNLQAFSPESKQLKSGDESSLDLSIACKGIFPLNNSRRDSNLGSKDHLFNSRSSRKVESCRILIIVKSVLGKVRYGLRRGPF